MCIIIFFSTRKHGRPVSVNIPFCICFYTTILGIIISSLFHKVGMGFRPFSYFLLLLPILLFTWESRSDKFKLLLYIVKAVIAVGLAYIIVCFFSTLMGFAQFNLEGRYAGVAIHPNTLGMGMAGIILCGFVLLYIRPSRAWKWATRITLGLSVVVLMLSGSRTSIIASFCVTITFLLIKYGKNNIFGKGSHPKAKKYSIKLIFLSVIIIVSAAIFVYAIYVVRSAGSPGAGASGVNLNDLSSNRLTLWQYCLSKLSIIGNDPQTLFDAMQLDSAHNIPLDFAYRFGVITGIAYLGVELLALKEAISIIFRKKYINDSSLLFTCLSTAAYIVVSMFEVSIMPFEFAVSFCFFIGLGPVMFRHDPSDGGLCKTPGVGI
jgi:hypothetical protein